MSNHNNLYGLFTFCLLSFLVAINAYAEKVKTSQGAHDISIHTSDLKVKNTLTNITTLVDDSIKSGYYPGAVVLVGYQGKLLYEGVFGYKRLLPNRAPMTENTVFDLASLTKVVATTPAVLQLVEEGKINLDAPVAQYWPDFAKEQKGEVTIRELMTHTSGLPSVLPPSKNHPDPDLLYAWHGSKAGLAEITRLHLKNAPGAVYTYSDINFMVLGHLVELISGERLDQYTQHHIYKKLHMESTRYLPDQSFYPQIAPTQMLSHELRWGKVHDPSAYAMGGIAGNAGLFSNANDLGVYAQNLIDTVNQESLRTSSTILKPATIREMMSVQSVLDESKIRGLGWELEVSEKKLHQQADAFSHTGWTGTYLWVNPKLNTWIVILTSRTHPKPAKKNKLIEDRKQIKEWVLDAITGNSSHAKN